MQLKSSLISFNHHFDSPVIPTKESANELAYNDLALFVLWYIERINKIKM